MTEKGSVAEENEVTRKREALRVALLQEDYAVIERCVEERATKITLPHGFPEAGALVLEYGYRHSLQGDYDRDFQYDPQNRKPWEEPPFVGGCCVGCLLTSVVAMLCCCCLR